MTRHNGGMLGEISKLRHAIVGVAIGGTTLLAAFGVIGAGSHEERFDAKTIVVEPRSDDTIRITEYVDQDFGHYAKHGYERLIPNDFGVPTDVMASSPDAPDDLSVVDEGSITRIRIGDPDTTIKNQHRYVLSYTYPDAMLSELGLLLDIVAPAGDGWVGDNETGRFEIVVTGVELADTGCNVGAKGAIGGCTLDRVPAPSRRSIASSSNRFPNARVCGSRATSWRSPWPIPSRFPTYRIVVRTIAGGSHRR